MSSAPTWNLILSPLHFLGRWHHILRCFSLKSLRQSWFCFFLIYCNSDSPTSVATSHIRATTLTWIKAMTFFHSCAPEATLHTVAKRLFWKYRLYISLLLKLVNNFPLYAIKIQISHEDLITKTVDKDLWTEFDTLAYFICPKEVFQKIFKSLLMFEKEDIAH